ncbi:MAG: hypothetical protein LBF63_03480 [Treponema sp.]|jgi:hypothetical protein|nr:hypothetical protein [Treponema sp.]
MEISQNTLPPEYQGLTFEKVWAALQENGRQMKEQREEAGRQMKEQREEAGRQMKEQREETNRLIREQRREMKEQREEANRLIRQNEKMMSDLGRKFGKIIEHMFIPNLKEKFNLLGYDFGKASSNILIGDKEHNIYTEIDVLLENGGCALAVEVKTQANISDIREHIKRMEKLRRYFDLHEDKRKLYGAMAAAVIPGNVHDYALKAGFYIIRQSGDNVSIEEPRDKPKAW